MKKEVFTPEGRVVLDLTVAKDIEIFGGQAAVDKYLHGLALNEKMLEMAEAELAKEG